MKSLSKILLFFLLFGCAASAPAAELDRLLTAAREQRLSQDPQWRRLLHYRRGLFGGRKSDIDGPNFFLSKTGRKDPEAELEATLWSFFEPLPASTDTQHPQCRYPARYAWLNERLHFSSDMPVFSCERYEAWRDKIDPGSVSLVFSAYYLNNPASMYGHTFLRVGRKSATGEERPLLDYTVNFAAQTRTRNGLVFALRGLAGGYPGTFSTLPYYMKVQQYNNLESRALWEYKLNLSTAQVDRLIQHLWEVGPTSFSYYFFNKNCSYQLLPMLEVADPSLDLTDRFRFRAIPVDTLRAVIEWPGLVSSHRFRPSALERMIASRSSLSPPERDLARRWALNPGPSEDDELNRLANDEQRRVLESAYDYFRYRTGFQRVQPADVQERERKILLAMNRLPVSTATATSLEIPAPPAPHLVHKTGRVGVGFGANRRNGFEEIQARGALHDLEADPTGFVEGSELEMMSLKLRAENGRGRFYVEDFTAIQVQAMTPWEDWIRKPSWRLHIRYARAHDLNQTPEGSGFAGVDGGSGFSFRLPFLREGFIYSMVEADSGVGGIFRDNYRAGIGGSFGITGAPMRWWRIHAKASYLRYGAGNISGANRLSLVQSLLLTKEFEFRLALDRENHYQEGALSLNRYF